MDKQLTSLFQNSEGSVIPYYAEVVILLALPNVVLSGPEQLLQKLRLASG